MLSIPFAIARRELRSLFCSPFAWLALATSQAILGYVFLIQLELFLEWKPRLPAVPGAPGITVIVVAPLLKTAAMVYLLMAPILTMRLVAEERRTGSITLLLCAPVSMTQIVLGKFAGIAIFNLAMVSVTALMPLSLLLGGSLDPGIALGGLLGLILAVSAFSAAGLFVSSLTAQPALAAAGTFALLFGMWVLDWSSAPGSERAGDLVEYLAITSHLTSLLRGVFDSGDVVYYLLFTATFLVLAIRQLDALRTRG